MTGQPEAVVEPGRVTIPDDLANEIRRDLAAGGETAARWLFGPKWPEGAEYVTTMVDDTLVHLLVGSVDGGPRPRAGQRVIALAAPNVSAAVGLVATVEEATQCAGRPIECRFDPYIPNDDGSHHGIWDVFRWVLLPSPAESQPCPGLDPIAGPCVHALGHPPVLDRSGGTWAHATNTGVYWNDTPPAAGVCPASVPCTPVDIARGYIPPGQWRTGGSRPRNLYIGPPRPDGIDVGRMDSPELTALVVAAVNAYRPAPGTLAQAPLDAVREYLDHAPTPPARPLQPAERAAVIRDVAARIHSGPGRVIGTYEYRLRLVGADEWLGQLADATEAEHRQGLPTPPGVHHDALTAAVRDGIPHGPACIPAAGGSEFDCCCDDDATDAMVRAITTRVEAYLRGVGLPVETRVGDAWDQATEEPR